MPEAIRVIFEDIYAQGISHSFLIAVPFAVLSLIAIIFLPNVPLTRMTTKERIEASEADLATVSVPQGMDAARRDRRDADAVGCRADAAAGDSAAPTDNVDHDVRITTTSEARTDAVRALEAEFGDLINRIRRILADNADRLSPGMLPGAYKVFTTIVRRESVTLSALAEALDGRQGPDQPHRARARGARARRRARPDPDDGRSSLHLRHAGGPRAARRRRARRRSTRSLDALDAWSIDEIHSLTRLLHALTHRRNALIAARSPRIATGCR